MKCPKCRYADSKVVESRDIASSTSIRRRRQCLQCAHRFTTYERVEVPFLAVIKKDGTSELFDRSKLISGLTKAIQKRPVTPTQVEELAADIERTIYDAGESEVASDRIGEMVMDRLLELDEVAYVRFASVYRSFADVSSFEQELARIRNTRDIVGNG